MRNFDSVGQYTEVLFRNRRAGKKRRALKKKSLFLLRRFFAITRIRRDIFTEQVNREEKKATLSLFSLLIKSL